jgi:hypothetical protein
MLEAERLLRMIKRVDGVQREVDDLAERANDWAGPLGEASRHLGGARDDLEAALGFEVPKEVDVEAPHCFLLPGV